MRPVRGPLEGVGGQAVIEGVMMKSPVGAAVAVREPSGRIAAARLNLRLLSERSQIWSKPVFRGFATLVDTLRLGMRALEWSALRQETGSSGDATEDAGEKTPKRSGGAGLSMALAFVVAIVFFVWLPLQLSKWIVAADESQLALHLLAGLFRIVFFVCYLVGISALKEVRRVFVYHGAEHQSIHAYHEHGTGLTPDLAKGYSPIHQRCGTSFLVLLVLVTVVLYAIIDSLVILTTGADLSPALRILYHVPLIPLVVGLSYEVLRAVDSHLETSSLARLLSRPGMFLQRLTTRKAGPEEAEVAIAALMVSLDEDPGEKVRMVELDGGAGDEGSP